MADDLNLLHLFGHSEPARALAPGEQLFGKGDPAQTMYVVRSGRVEIRNGSTLFDTVESGGLLGEMALVDASPRSASAVAVEASEVIEIDQRRFLFMLQQTPFFAIHVMRVLAARLRAMNQRV